MRAALVVELIAIAAVAIAPVPLPSACVLAIASVSLWVRGRTWTSSSPAAPTGLAALGAACGLVALALALVLSLPIGDLTGRAVEWSQYTVVRGSPSGFIAIGSLIAAQVVAIEMSLRGWLIPRVLESVPRGGPALAGAISALAEAAITRGHLATRAGAFALGLGGAILFLGAGRRLAAPLACRLAFELGAVILVALRLIG